MVADQPDTVEHAIDDFMEALWEAIAIVLAVSIVSLGLRAGAIVVRLDPACARDRVRGHGGVRHRPSAHLARRPHHRARPAGRRRHDHHREHGQPPGARRRPRNRPPSSPMTPPLIRGSPARSSPSRASCRSASPAAPPANTPFSIFAVVAHRADRLLDRRRHLFAPLLGVWHCSSRRRRRIGETPGAVDARLPPLPGWRRCGPAGSPSLVTLALFGAALLGTRFVPQQFFPPSDRPELLVDLKLARQRLDLRDTRRCRGPSRQAAQGRSRRRPLEHLCRPRRHPLLSAARTSSLPTTSSPRRSLSPRDSSSASG